MKKYLFILISLLVISTSCRTPDKKEEIKTAEIVMNDAEYIYNDDDGPVHVKTSKLEIWLIDKKRVLEHFEFSQLDKDDDTLIMQGKGDWAEIRDSNSKMDMKGGVEIYVYENGEVNIIKADELILESNSGDVLAKGNFELDWGGMTIYGEGIKGNVKKGKFNFNKVREGYLR